MSKKILTIAMIEAVFGTEDKAPIKIVKNASSVTAKRDDTELKAPSTDIAGIEAAGSYSLSFGEDGAPTVEAVAESKNKTRQSPLLDVL